MRFFQLGYRLHRNTEHLFQALYGESNSDVGLQVPGTHIAIKALECLTEQFPSHTVYNICPPRFLDLTPMDCYGCGVIVNETYKDSNNSKDSVTASNVDVMANIKKEHTINASNRN